MVIEVNKYKLFVWEVEVCVFCCIKKKNATHGPRQSLIFCYFLSAETQPPTEEPPAHPVYAVLSQPQTSVSLLPFKKGTFLTGFSTVVPCLFTLVSPWFKLLGREWINQEQWGVSRPSSLDLSSVLVSALFSRGVAVGFSSVASHNPTTNPRPMRRTQRAKSRANQATQNDTTMAVCLRARFRSARPRD